MLEMLKLRGMLIIAYLGDAMHRRMVVAGALFLLNRWLGSEIAGIDDITNIIDVFLGLSAAAWTKSTIKAGNDEVGA